MEITKEMNILEAVQKYPQISQVFAKYGLEKKNNGRLITFWHQTTRKLNCKCEQICMSMVIN